MSSNPTLQEFVRSRAMKLMLVAVACGILLALTDGIVAPRVNDATSLSFQLLGMIDVVYILFSCLAGIAVVVLLFRRKWVAAASWSVTWCILYSADFAALALKGDRFTFTGKPHQEIADIY